MEPKFNIYNLSLEECDIIALALDGLICNSDVDAFYDRDVAEDLFQRFDEIAETPGIEKFSTAKVENREGNLLRVKFSA